MKQQLSRVGAAMADWVTQLLGDVFFQRLPKQAFRPLEGKPCQKTGTQGNQGGRQAGDDVFPDALSKGLFHCLNNGGVPNLFGCFFKLVGECVVEKAIKKLHRLFPVALQLGRHRRKGDEPGLNLKIVWRTLLLAYEPGNPLNLLALVKRIGDHAHEIIVVADELFEDVVVAVSHRDYAAASAFRALAKAWLISVLERRTEPPTVRTN